MFAIDLKDAHFQIPIHPISQLFLLMTFAGRSTNSRLFALAFPQHASLHQDVCSLVGLGSQERDGTPSVSG